MLSAALTDPFPEAKRECCSLLLRLAEVCPGGLRARLGKVCICGSTAVPPRGEKHSKSGVVRQEIRSAAVCEMGWFYPQPLSFRFSGLRTVKLTSAAAVKHPTS